MSVLMCVCVCISFYHFVTLLSPFTFYISTLIQIVLNHVHDVVAVDDDVAATFG